MKAFKVLGFKAVQQQKDSLVGASLELNYIFCRKKVYYKNEIDKITCTGNENKWRQRIFQF